MSYELAIIAALCVGGALGITKILRKSSDYELKLLKKQFKALEIYTSELEEDNKSLQNTMNRKERGPAIEGEPSELKTILPQLLGEFGHLAPKWMQPLLKNDGFSQWIAEYVEKHPDKAAAMFGKFFKGKEKPQQQNGRQYTETL